MFIIFIISGLFRHRTLPIISLSKGMPNVSVVIAARNEEDNIQNIIDDLISQFVQLKVDQMSTNDLVEHVKQDLTDYYNDWSIDELETIIEEELLEELVDNVTNETITQGGQS